MSDRPPSPPLPPRPKSWLSLWVLAWLVVCLAVTWGLGVEPVQLLRNPHELVEYLGRFTRPDFRGLVGDLPLLGETLAVALWGTFLAAAFGVLVAPLATRGLSPHPVVYRATRLAINVMRSVPDPMLALVFVSGMGIGPLPGVLALAAHTGGFLAKVFAESLERVGPGVYEAVAATGAAPVQVLMFAGWPSVGREVVGYTLFILDRNVRMACALGLVQAGGIGQPLRTSLRLFEYDRASALLLLILTTVLVVELVSGVVRHRLR